MDIFIRFVGLILLVSNTDGTYHAVLPKWENIPLCQGKVVEEHKAYIRVRKGLEQLGTVWTERTSCDELQDCTLYQIPERSTLEITGGFRPVGHRVIEGEDFCLVPQFVKERILPNAAAHEDLLGDRSIANLPIPAGILSGAQLDNDAVVAALRIIAPRTAGSNDVTIVARPRDGGKERILKVPAGTLIQVLNLPEHSAIADLDADHHHDTTQQDHFPLYTHLLANVQPCGVVPKIATLCNPRKRRDRSLGVESDDSLSCSVGGCCKR